MNEASPKQRTIYTTVLEESQEDDLLKWLCSNHWEEYRVEYARFAFRGPSTNVVLYNSHKLVVQGKKTEEFVQFILEPYILKQASLGYEDIAHPEWFEEHAGMDESGKGDLFGPLVTACVIADHEQIEQFLSIGVKDSKQISNDRAILSIADKIRSTGCIAEVMTVSMEKYNELYTKFHNNMNLLLGWMHCCSLKNALARKRVPWGMLDQFSKQPIVQNMLRDPLFELRMQTKAESDPVVAAASIIARAEYVRKIEELSQLADMPLMKGASERVTEQARTLKEIFGPDKMKNFLKLHFKNAP